MIRDAITVCTPKLRTYAANLSRQVQRAESTDDLLQAGLLAVLVAEPRFDPRRGKPHPFVMRRAQLGMIDHLRSLFGRPGTRANVVRLPRSLAVLLEKSPANEPVDLEITPADALATNDERQRQWTTAEVEAQRFTDLIAAGMTVSAAAHRLGLTALQMQALARYLGLRPPHRRNVRPEILDGLRKYLVMPVPEKLRLCLVSAYLDGVALVASLRGEYLD